MRIEIEIPKEFEEHFKQDKFKDSLERIMADIKHSLENGDCLCAGSYEYETIEMLQKAFEDSKPAYSVDKVVEELKERTDFLKDCKKYGNKNAKQQAESYNTMMMYEIADLVDDLIEIVKQGGVEKEREAEEYNGGWISVKDRLPDKAGSYLVIGKSGGATVTRWYMPSEFYPEGHFGGNGADYIRYWMPRPEPPKESD